MEKFQKPLSSRKRNYFPKGGKLTLTLSDLNAIATYFLPLIRVHMSKVFGEAC